MESNSLLQNRLEELAFINQAIFYQINRTEIIFFDSVFKPTWNNQAKFALMFFCIKIKELFHLA